MSFGRYVIVFFTIALGGAAIGTLLTLVAGPLLNRVRGSDTGRAIAASFNGVGVGAAVLAASALCKLTGGEATYAMFAAPLAGTIANDLGRIRGMGVRYSLGGQVIDRELELREGLVRSEKMNLVGDMLGFAIGIALLSPLAWW